jgi:uncharacterized phage protein (TIGR01671 family)
MWEIEFRGKRKDTGEWVCGYYVKADNTHYIFTGKTGLSKVTPAHCLMYRDFERYEVIRETVVQYTELKDRNGDMIFEGDILRKRDGFTEDIILVRRDCEHCGFVYDYIPSEYAPHDGVMTFSLFHFCSDEHEIIGNIRDAPGLLEKTQ